MRTYALQILPALMLWAVVLIRLAGFRFGWKMGMLPALLAVTIGATLDIDFIYVSVDALLGHQNVINLIVHVMVGAGLTSLSGLLLRATGRSTGHSKILVLIGVVLFVVQLVLFLLADTAGTATAFTDTFGDQLYVALYQASFFAWVGLVVGYTGVECLRREKSSESRMFSVGFDILSAGCLAGVIGVAAKMTLIIVEIKGATPAFTPAVEMAYKGFIALALLLFAVGLILPSYARIRAALVARTERVKALDALRPLVRRLAATPEGKHAMAASQINLTARTSKVQLYRWFIFIGDIRVLDHDLITPGEVTLIDELGARLEQQGASTWRKREPEHVPADEETAHV
jgi:uncharacterized membrane protein YtjA (UPF0391 family)